MKVTVARIRSNVRYNGPLQTVLDSFFENYVRWQQTRPDLEFDTYNMSFDKSRPVRNPETVRDADVIIIPSDSEFRYHSDLQIDPRDLAKSESHIDAIRPYFENKKVIVWRSDRGDTAELYRDETLKGINLKSLNVIDEIDFSGNIHGMKYHFIKSLKDSLGERNTQKTLDFGYWGKMKKGDDRAKTLRKIYRDTDISNVLIGGFPSGIVRDSKWIKDWNKLYPMLEPARTTLCFNWIDETATTARYPEALSIGMIPFVWMNYDKNNTYNIDDWQRVFSFEDFKEKVMELQDPKVFESKLVQYRENYKQVLLTEEAYSREFNKLMNEFI